MAKANVNRSDVPIRLFKSDFLEFFTHIHPAVIVALWLPVAVFFIIFSIATWPFSVFAGLIPLLFVAGIVLWSFTEYILHRFVFHFHATSDLGKRIVFLYHGIHHEQPLVKSRLVMPPVVSIPLAFVFYGLFSLILGALAGAWYLVPPLFSGFTIGYLAYDMTHYATHHFKITGGLPLYLKRYHMLHHFKTWDKRFGVSSPLWDFVFRTKPEE